MSDYMHRVHDQHLPKISLEKKNEREKNMYKQEENVMKAKNLKML